MKCYLHSKGHVCGKYKNFYFVSTTAHYPERVDVKFKDDQHIKDLRIFSCSTILKWTVHKKISQVSPEKFVCPVFG